MSQRKTPRVPKLRVHKATGQAYVVFNGQAVYLGRADKPESKERYHQIIAEWLAAGRQRKVEPTSLTIDQLVARFWLHAREYYRDAGGRPTAPDQVVKPRPMVLFRANAAATRPR